MLARIARFKSLHPFPESAWDDIFSISKNNTIFIRSQTIPNCKSEIWERWFQLLHCGELVMRSLIGSAHIETCLMAACYTKKTIFRWRYAVYDASHSASTEIPQGRWPLLGLWAEQVARRECRVSFGDGGGIDSQQEEIKWWFWCIEIYIFDSYFYDILLIQHDERTEFDDFWTVTPANSKGFGEFQDKTG